MQSKTRELAILKENQKLRESFIELAIETFDLSFESWHQNGYWTNKYIPYAIVDGGKIVANASVNIIDTIWEKHPKRYIQIGTVMTKMAYRGKGLSRCIMKEILKDWQNNCDAIYLFANDTVLDFYPKFGFVKETEYQFTMPIISKGGNVKKLDMTRNEDRDLLKRYYAKSNPFSALPMLNNYGLLMFYCSAFMKDCVFYCEELDAVVVAVQNNNTLDTPKLKYVFDVSDMGGRDNSRRPFLWEMREHHEQPIWGMFADKFDIHADNLLDGFYNIAKDLWQSIMITTKRTYPI